MKILKHQHWHLLILMGLLYALNLYTNQDSNVFNGSLWNICTENWFILAIFFPIIHQIYVLLCWRYELFYKGLTNIFKENAFKIYKRGFIILILSRPILIIMLSISNAMTINIGPTLPYILSLALLLPGAYAQYSVFKYFGIDKAFGLDHFKPEKFRNEPLCKKGIFKYTSNGMYTFAFFLIWIPGVLLQSKAALLAALFNHIYIWVHYYFTELPDMKIIYEKKQRN